VGTASKSFHVKQKTPILSLTVQLLLLPIGCQDKSIVIWQAEAAPNGIQSICVGES
jgi:hypothetical protein